jgi:redox-sensing transcriptional repressor
VQYLSRHIAAALGLTHDWKVAIVGAGNLGKALARYGGFESRGFDVVAIFDADQMVVGNEVGWLRVSDVADLETVLHRTGANMVVLALPAAVAQDVCDRVVAAGVRSVLSFAPVMLQVPEGVTSARWTWLLSCRSWPTTHSGRRPRGRPPRVQAVPGPTPAGVGSA